MPVYVAMRNWHPLIADVVTRMCADGVTRILALCLAPQNSSTSTGLYLRAVMSALAALAAANPGMPKIALNFIESWVDEPALIAAFAERLVACYPSACAEVADDAGASVASLPILFTAHSVPCSTLLSGNAAPDSYPDEAKRTAALVYTAVARQIPALGEWFFAYQSQGASGGLWLGPTVEETLTALRNQGHAGVVIQPVGFLCDHVEILYDIDIAFAECARRLGLRLIRCESLNDSPQLTQALLNVALHQLGKD
jgi:ferrochelatase